MMAEMDAGVASASRQRPTASLGCPTFAGMHRVAFMTARLRRLCGAGLMLFLLHGLALASLGLAVSYFHHRTQLLLEPFPIPLLPACGGHDPVARLHAADLLLARAGALDDWQPVCWVVVSALLSSLLGALAVSVNLLRRTWGGRRQGAWGLFGLHLLVLGLAMQLLRLYEQVWRGMVTGLPAACMVGPTALEDDATSGAHRTVPQMLAGAGLPVPQLPDALAMVVSALLLAATVVGIWLWWTLPLSAVE